MITFILYYYYYNNTGDIKIALDPYEDCILQHCFSVLNNACNDISFEDFLWGLNAMRSFQVMRQANIE